MACRSTCQTCNFCAKSSILTCPFSTQPPLEELEEGAVVEGVITDIWLYHGCQIDVGNQFDGLIPMLQDEWMQEGVREALMPGDRVKARVHRVLQPGLYRWPVQLEMLEPAEIAGRIMDPEEYNPPIDHAWCAEQGWGMDEILEATGRTYEATNYLLPLQHDDAANELQQAMGFDVENEGMDHLPNPMEERIMVDLHNEINDLAMRQS